MIFTNEEDDVKNIEIVNPLGKSDHGVIMCDIICEWKTNAFFIPMRLYHKGNYEQMNTLINEVDWEAVFTGLNIHQRWELFKRKLEEFAKQCVPKTEPKQYKTPWMNRKVVKAYKINNLLGRDIWSIEEVIYGGSMSEKETLPAELKEMKDEHMRKN